MSETKLLFDVYKAIDDRIAGDPSVGKRLGSLFGAYADGQAIGWTSRFSDWRIRRESLHLPAEQLPADAPPTEPSPGGGHATTGDALDEVTVALHALAATRPSPRGAARRMLALAAAMRVFPELRPGGSEAAAAQELLLAERRLARTPESSALLHERLTEDSFGRMSDWNSVVRSAVEDGLVSSGLGYQTDAPPCIGRLVMMTDPNDDQADPVPVLTTSFRTDAVTFEACKDHLSPENWPAGSDFWCSMAPTPATQGQNPRIYEEVVSIDCQHQATAWTMRTPLEVWFSHPEPDWAYLEYDLPAGSPTLDADIEIDQGYISVRRDGAGIRVETSKRVRFAGSLDGACMAMISCATGYGAAAEDMVFNLADHAATNAAPPYPFPVQYQAPARRHRGSHPVIHAPTPSDPAPPAAPVSKIGEVLQGWATFAEWAVASWGTHLGTVATHATAGAYPSDAAMDDLAAGVKLSSDTLVRLLGEAGDAMAIMTSDIDHPADTATGRFTIHPTLLTHGACTLTVRDPLTSVAGGSLPPGCLTLVPNVISAPGESFVFQVDGTGHCSRIYRGMVVATDPAGIEKELPAFVMLP